MTNCSLIGVEKSRSALVFIEFQHEWLNPNGILQKILIRDKEPFQEAVQTAARVLRTARHSGWKVAHAGLDLSQDPNYLLFNGGERVAGLRAAIPRAGTWKEMGSSYAEPFRPHDDEFVVNGRSGASALKNSTLDPFLRNSDVNTLFLLGFATHVCVESTLREAHDLGYNAYVVHDGCASFETAQHDHVRRHVIHHFGDEVSASDLIEKMEE